MSPGTSRISRDRTRKNKWGKNKGADMLRQTWRKKNETDANIQKGNWNGSLLLLCLSTPRMATEWTLVPFGREWHLFSPMVHSVTKLRHCDHCWHPSVCDWLSVLSFRFSRISVTIKNVLPWMKWSSFCEKGRHIYATSIEFLPP